MFQPPRGTRDYLPEDQLKKNWVIDQVREVYEAYGFEPLGTPAFENLEMLMIKSGKPIWPDLAAPFPMNSVRRATNISRRF